MTSNGLLPDLTSGIVIIGIGNLLLKDEGVGVHIIRELEKTTLPEDVSLIDAGTATLDALQMLGNVEKLIVIDAVKGGGKPGTVYKFKPEDIISGDVASISLHQLGFMEALSIVERTGKSFKDITIIGVEPKEIVSGMELSPEIARKIPEIIKLIKKTIREK
ncbi:Ni,Fe-hydrogenase maturation factor [candidate division KSB1 bacterium]|nr:MAG: Ni,Fe-hydrogenase maturation factor [candidate division KSB1 bacterium]